MVYFKDDKQFSDEVFSSNEIKNELLKSTLFSNACIKTATEKEDIQNCIDAYIDDCPIQYRVQKKAMKIEYYPTIRYKRENSKHTDRIKSEYFKIKYNIENGEKYPKYLIWCLIDNNTNRNLLKLIIVDIKEIYKYDVNYFKEIINNDKSSSFLVLEDIEYVYVSEL